MFVDSVKFENEATLDDCKSLIEDFSMAQTLFTKFEEIWSKLQIKEKDPSEKENSHEVGLKKTSWLLFIIAKGIISTLINFLQ